MFLIITFILAIFFLVGTCFLTALSTSVRRMHRRDSNKKVASTGKWFFFRNFQKSFFKENDYEAFVFNTVCAQNLARFGFLFLGILFLLETPLFQQEFLHEIKTASNLFWIVISVAIFFLISFIFGEYLPRILGTKQPEKVFKFFTPFSSIFMCLAFPVSYIFLKISHSFSRTVYFDQLYQPESEAKQEIIDIIQEAELSPDINKHDKKLIESVLSFRDRIAREVMVPRVDVFSLPLQTTIKEAANLIAAEGYSRTPIYNTTIDEICGVLMYKDILTKYREYVENGNDETILNAPIESIQKNILYTPETKKISSLLQEFRKQQVHLAIVVDEYGGTAGIVTIEDILEEIVGEIADEYDNDEILYKVESEGTWLVDARMSIFDLEDLLNIKIPQEGEYDTIGGYVFHCAGTIPIKGFMIYQDEFEIEVIDSNERVVEKIRIKPIHSFGTPKHNQTIESDE